MPTTTVDQLITRSTTYTSLLCATACKLADDVVDNAIHAGVTQPNREAVLLVAIDKVVALWRSSAPELWAHYCVENGLPVDGAPAKG